MNCPIQNLAFISNSTTGKFIEVLSPSNRAPKVKAQRSAAGTQAFWIVDTVERSIQLFYANNQDRLFLLGKSVPVLVAPGEHALPVAALFNA